jgi:alkanesulfonate monooxygenase SsuD/methylene tetrahydromethanopterin reductase-like flavin-dependent oxidoreductase (luciferase family)
VEHGWTEDAVKFGLSCNTGYYCVDPDKIAAFARHAEDCGFESFYVPEHIVLYPGAMLGPIEISAFAERLKLS